MDKALEQVYLVGGAVRDLLLKRASNDNDFRFTYTQKPKKNMHLGALSEKVVKAIPVLWLMPAQM